MFCVYTFWFMLVRNYIKKNGILKNFIYIKTIYFNSNFKYIFNIIKNRI